MKAFLLFFTLSAQPSIAVASKNFFQAGLEQFELGKYEQAAESFSAYLQKKPDDVIALYNRGLCYYENNDWDNAITDFNKALGLKNDYAQAKEKLSFALIKRATQAFEEDRLEAALADLDTYLELNPEDDVALFNKGIILSKINRKKEAVDEFTKAITRNAQTEYFLNRALDYYALKDFNKCLADLNDVIKALPHDTTALWLRASIQYEKKNYAEAKKDLEVLIQLKPDNAAVRDLYFINNFSYFVEKNKYLVAALLVLLLAGIFFSIKALMKRSS